MIQFLPNFFTDFVDLLLVQFCLILREPVSFQPGHMFLGSS